MQPQPPQYSPQASAPQHMVMDTSSSHLTPYIKAMATMAATQAATAPVTFSIRQDIPIQQKPVLPLSTLQAIMSTNMSPVTLERIMRNLEETHTLPNQFNTHHRSLATDLQETPLQQQTQIMEAELQAQATQQQEQDSTQGSMDPDIQGTMADPDPALDMLVDGILSMPDHLLVRRHGLPAAPTSTHQDMPVRRQETLIIHPEALEDPQQPSSRLRQGPLLLNRLILPLRRTLINHQRLILMHKRNPIRNNPLSSTTTQSGTSPPVATPTVLVGSEILI